MANPLAPNRRSAMIRLSVAMYARRTTLVKAKRGGLHAFSECSCDLLLGDASYFLPLGVASRRLHEQLTPARNVRMHERTQP